MVFSFPSKTSKVDMEYAAPFSITLVFSHFSQKLEKTPFETVTNQLQMNHLSPTVDNISAKLARVLLAEKSFCPPLAEAYFKEQKLIPNVVYELPFKVTIENKLRSFQIKLLHNIISTNQCLWIEDEHKNFLSVRGM